MTWHDWAGHIKPRVGTLKKNKNTGEGLLGKKKMHFDL
jgi:hypothetical protein